MALPLGDGNYLGFVSFINGDIDVGKVPSRHGNRAIVVVGLALMSHDQE
jgi:hypothetical protein